MEKKQAGGVTFSLLKEKILFFPRKKEKQVYNFIRQMQVLQFLHLDSK